MTTVREPVRDLGPALVAGGLIALVLVHLAGALASGLSDGFVVGFFSRYALSALIGCALVWLARARGLFDSIGLGSRPTRRLLAIGVGSYVVVLPAILWIHAWNEDNVLGGKPTVQTTMVAFLELVQEGPLMIVVAMTVVLAIAVPLLEELVFRGWMLSGFRESTKAGVGEPASSVLALLLSTAAFTLVHPQFTWVPIAAMGFVLGVLRLRTGSLWPCVVFHGVHNVFTLYYPVLA